nr:uncharacterized protein LOC105463389 [Macaca nemestrina]
MGAAVGAVERSRGCAIPALPGARKGPAGTRAADSSERGEADTRRQTTSRQAFQPPSSRLGSSPDSSRKGRPLPQPASPVSPRRQWAVGWLGTAPSSRKTRERLGELKRASASRSVQTRASGPLSSVGRPWGTPSRRLLCLR